MTGLGVFNVQDYGAKGDTRFGSDGAITAADNTFTSATASFVASDVGKTIIVKGAGPAIGAGPDALKTTITGVTGPTEVTVKTPATTAVTAGSYSCGTDDQAAIQAALDAAGAAAAQAQIGTRATVVVPGANTYMLHYVVDFWGIGNKTYAIALGVPNNVEFVGVGGPRLLADAHAEPRPHRGNGNNLIGSRHQAPVSNVAVRAVTLDGGYSPNEYRSGVAFPDSSEDYFQINWGAADHFEITGCTFVGNYGDSIRVGDTHANYGLIADNYLTLANGQFINVIYASHVIVRGNRCFDSQASAGGSSEAIPINSPQGPVIVDSNIVDKAGVIEVAGTPGPNAWTVISNNIVRTINGAGDSIYINKGVASGNIVDHVTYAANTGRGVTVVNGVATGNKVYLNSKVTGTITGVSIQDPSGAGAPCLVANNHITSDGPPSLHITDVAVGGTHTAPCQIMGNLCQAGRTSIAVNGAGAIVTDNKCSGAFAGGSGSTALKGAAVRGNRFAVPAAGSNASALRIVGDPKTPSLVADNYLDLTANTGPDPTGIWCRRLDAGGAGGTIFRGNILAGVPGVGVFWADAPNGEVWDNNTILNGGTLTLKNATTVTRTYEVLP